MRDGGSDATDPFDGDCDGIDPRAAARLDSAIRAWTSRAKSRRRRRVVASVGLACAAVAVIVSQRPTDRPSEPSVIVEAPAALPAEESVRSVPPAPPVVAAVSDEPTAADDRLADATQTADRLAYAFQPVSDGVGDVMRLLIDAVPGAGRLTL